MFVGKIAKIIETFILGVFFGLAPLAAFFIATVLFASIVFGKETIGPWTLWSLLLGLFTDILFLKRWVKNAYTMSAKAIGAVYIFYSVCAVGFFMGLPIGNIFLGILAGVYAAWKMHFTMADEERRNQYFRITLWAIAGKMIGYRFETPFLSFTFTIPIFFAIVLAGGISLVLLQYYLTCIFAKITYKRLKRDTV
jgi:hypothetical protein